MSGKNASPPPSRLRILVAGATGDDAGWADWQDARQASPNAARIALQRVARTPDGAIACAAGIGYGETLRWFGPVDSALRRRQIIAYAGSILEAGELLAADAELSALLLAPGRRKAGSEAAETLDGLIVLSHAETDLLALERARAELPPDFPRLQTASLMQLGSADRLLALFGGRRASTLLAIVRVHGTVASVPGLDELIELAHRERWGLVVISGVGAAELLPRTANISAQLAANLTSYFMAGGLDNLTQALRYAMAEYRGLALAYAPPRPMPAHGLYHPDLLITSAAEWEGQRATEWPVAIVVFYRAHVLSNNLDFVDCMLRALEARGFAAVGVFTSSLRDRDAAGIPVALDLLASFPDVIVNTVNFPVVNLNSLVRAPANADRHALETVGAPLLQAICCGSSRETWAASARGLSATEAAISIVLPECDARVISVPISFKERHRYASDAERIGRVAGLAQRLAVLRRKANADKRIAIVLSNAGGKAQRIGGAVGMDTPASLLKALRDLQAAGYDVGELPDSAEALMQDLLARGCYDEKLPLNPQAVWRLPRRRYRQWFRAQSPGFQQALTQSWGEPSIEGPTIARPFWRGDKQSNLRAPMLLLHEPYTDEHDYLFGGLEFGKVLIAIQPPRGFGFDAEAIYHAPDLPPCHHYAAFYRWLDEGWQADALVHFGTHGTLEWLPGKSLAMSADCAPDVLLGELPLIYPFIVNNPGEGAQAKRRTHAVIVGHLVPPQTQADRYGPLASLAKLVEEYYRSEVLDTAKLPLLRRQIWELVRSANLEDDLKQLRQERHGNHVHEWDDRTDEHGVPLALERLSGRGFAHLLEDLDTYLCDLGRTQIRDGLHVFGAAPAGAALIDLMFAILRSANGEVPALVDTMTRLCGIEPATLREARGAWSLPIDARLAGRLGTVVTASQLRSGIDALARDWLREMAGLGFSAAAMEAATRERHASEAAQAQAALAELLRIAQFVALTLAPDLARTTDETRHLLGALNGAYVPAGAAGSPTRGMAHVLPTGRNFYTVDPRSLPTPTAWAVGSALAREALNRHRADKGEWPESIALSIWGTPTLRNGGDDIAQALALLGVRPLWDSETRAARGVEVIPLAELGRPRIDVTLRVSGFFRDAFPTLMQLFDEAVQRVVLLDEAPKQNFIRKHWLEESAALAAQGQPADAARRQASYRVFSTRPGVYGTGLMELVDSGDWRDSRDLAEAMVRRGSWAYSPEASDGVEAVNAFRRKLAGIELVLHNQDSAEQDLFDSSDYFEFHGGLVAAVHALAGRAPAAYVGDATDPAHPLLRTLQAEALRVYRTRVTNPKWLQAIQRHGYRGGLEMAATMDALFGFAATAGIIRDWMFEGVAEHFTQGQGREFLQAHNPWALNAITERLLEAGQRGLWTAREETMEQLRATLLDSEACIEDTSGHLK